MAVTLTPRLRLACIGAVSAAFLIGSFAVGLSLGGTSSPGPGPGGQHGAPLTTVASAAPTARITVTGTGTVSGTPDQLTLDMGVQVTGGSVGSALDQASQAVDQVTAALRSQGVAAADIQTSGLSVQPDYADGSQVPVGYQASESVTVTLRRIAAAGTQIAAAVRAGGNAVTVDGVSLNLTDTSGLLAAARARAVADARTRAAQYARALSQPLGPVISITEQSQETPPTVPQFAGAAAGKASTVPISPGSQQLSVSVTVVYALA